VTAAPPKLVYDGPTSGTIRWSGSLERNQTLVIDGKQASIGSVDGELPGVPVNVALTDEQRFAITQFPSPANGWKRVSVRATQDSYSVVIKWTLR
jgi:hypothetical protein